jgi:hypothetical protein
MSLSEAEQNALDFLKYKGGACLVTDVEDRNSRDVFGTIVPGMRVFKKLEKKGLVYFTEEDECFPEMPGFRFTEEIYLVTE